MLLGEYMMWPGSNSELKDRQVQFGKFYFAVLANRGWNLELERKEIEALWRDKSQFDQTEQAVAECMEFIRRHTTHERVERYVALRMALMPRGKAYLRVLRDLYSGIGSLPKSRYYDERVRFFEGCMALNEIWEQDPTQEMHVVLAKALSSEGEAVHAAGYAMARDGLKDLREGIREKAKDILERLPNRSKAQQSLLDKLQGKTYECVLRDSGELTDRDQYRNSYFGF